ncbi:MAG: hypothetical protein JNN15_12505, partial [Blastocatellia bacterium]|nr:hypothetical protein [Blastocatellia bacterium]
PTFYADIFNPQSLNKYQYCYNNPVNFVDPDGHQGLDVIVKEAVKQTATKVAPRAVAVIVPPIGAALLVGSIIGNGIDAYATAIQIDANNRLKIQIAVNQGFEFAAQQSSQQNNNQNNPSINDKNKQAQKPSNQPTNEPQLPLSPDLSKGGKKNVRDSGLEGIPDQDINDALKNNKSPFPKTQGQPLTAEEKRRLQREQKARGDRNKNKRNK